MPRDDNNRPLPPAPPDNRAWLDGEDDEGAGYYRGDEVDVEELGGGDTDAAIEERARRGLMAADWRRA